MSLLGTAIAYSRAAHHKLRYAMRLLNEEPAEKLVDMAERAEILVHEAHDILERMDTNLTLAEAKLALTRHLIAKRHHHEQSA
jgi:predicted transcriptional regulator